MSKRSRNLATSLVRYWAKRPINYFPGNSSYFPNLDREAALSNLRGNGIHSLGTVFDSAAIAEIVNSLKGLSAFDYLVDKAVLFDVDERPAGVRSAMFRREDLSRIDAVTRIANDPKLLSVVQGYLGAKPLLSNILTWWSYPSDSPTGPQKFHRDVDDFKFIKMFLYLTNVDIESGPHVYVKSSHDDDNPGMRELRRYDDFEIEQGYDADSITTIQGQAGTAFLSDSFGFHKGLPPVSKPRLLLQFQWSLLPIGIEDYKPAAYKPSYPYDSDINRLLIRK